MLMRGMTAAQNAAGVTQPAILQKRRFVDLLVEYAVCGAELKCSGQLVLEKR